MRSPHSRVGNSAVSAAGYLKSPLQEVPLPITLPPLIQEQQQWLDRVPKLWWTTMRGSSWKRTHSTHASSSALSTCKAKKIYTDIYHIYSIYNIFILIALSGSCCEKFTIEWFKQCFGRFTVYTCLSSPGGYKYPWRVYPMPYPAMVRIRAPYTIYAIYVSGCPWSIREYIHSPPLSRSVCHFRANVFFHFSSIFHATN